MGANLYCSCSTATFYLKTLCLGNQHNLGSCILDVTFNGVFISNRFSKCVACVTMCSKGDIPCFERYKSLQCWLDGSEAFFLNKMLVVKELVTVN